MMTSRRGLLGMLAAGVGAAIVRPGILMPIKPTVSLRKMLGWEYAIDSSAGAYMIKFQDSPAIGDTLTLNGERYTFTLVNSSDLRSPFAEHLEFVRAT